MRVPPPFGRTVPGNRWDLVDEIAPDTQATGVRTVSVIVVHYDQQSELDRTLAALGRQTVEPLEIIVVDDGSPHPPRVPDGVQLVVQEDLGFRAAAARNLGAARSTGDILCFLDADTTPEPDYLERMVHLPSRLPEAVVAGHRKHADFAGVPATDPVEVAGPAHELPEPVWLLDAYRGSRNLLDADDRSYRFVIGATFACTRWFFGETGGFDEGFTAYGGEDWHWAHRAWLTGAVFAHEPRAVAWHDGADWAARHETASDERHAANAEALRLSSRIPVAGSRPRALLTAAPDVVAVLHEAATPTAAFICVDSLLVRLPHARVVVPDAVAATFADDPRVSAASNPHPRGRVRIDLAATVRFAGPGDARPVEAPAHPAHSALDDAVAEVGVGELGTVRLGAHVTVTSERQLRRLERWGESARWTTQDGSADGIAAVEPDARLAAYLGGWN